LVTLLVADAPAHGIQYHEASVSDDHESVPEGSLENAVLKLSKIPTDFYFCCFKLNKTTDKMYSVMKKVYQDLEIADAARPDQFLILLINSLT
jgi:hypothetical protein